MFVTSTAYRFQSGHVEGFVGSALSNIVAADVAARRKIARKAMLLGESFEAKRLINSDRGLSAAEKKTIREDWKVSARSSRV